MPSPILELRRRAPRLGSLGVFAACLSAGLTFAADPEEKVDFDRDVRPILSDNCFACHGPDPNARAADLRLDRPDELLRESSDRTPVVPGDPDASELVFRVEVEDESLRMPPEDSGKSLTPEEVATLRDWVEQGADSGEHWAFVSPRRGEVPEVRDRDWPRNPIDRFILDRLEREGLSPSPEADRPTLIRRLSLDLTGLPPTPEEVEAFVADDSADAYETLVDRLLQSARFGEHMARIWLDAARYGDTHGLHLDNYREMWPYRDWVIRAFNENLPYDRFLTEQLAGDLLPNPTRDQLVATGFNRCHVTTNEGGSIAEEFIVRNTVDRVETTGTVFLGLTVGCARCHDHKFDPLTTEEYYQLFAFFNNIDGGPLDGNVDNPPPFIQLPTPEQAKARADLDRQIASIRRTISEEVSKATYDEAAEVGSFAFEERSDYVWIDDELPEGARPGTDRGRKSGWKFVAGPGYPVYSGGRSVMRAARGPAQQYFTLARPELRIGDGDALFAYVYIDPARPPKEILLQWQSDGWSHRASWCDREEDATPGAIRVGPLPEAGRWARLQVEAARVGLKAGAKVGGWAFSQHGGTIYWDRAGIKIATPRDGQLFDRFSEWLQARREADNPELPDEIRQLVAIDPVVLGPHQFDRLRRHFIEHAYWRTRPRFDPLHAELARLEGEYQRLDEQIATTLVFKERPDRMPAYVLERGEYDMPSRRVERGTPAFLPPMRVEGTKDRLNLARWLVAPEHPLTARVAVNRLWQQCFGTGLVRTAEDFGSQGEPPSHPELLDWLAVEFREGGWDVKAFMKRVVSSATYRQSSRVTEALLSADPENRLLARGPRFRLDAETLRDQALAVSGLLVEEVGGPSVKVPQPSGLWEAVAYPAGDTSTFSADTGRRKVHRRSLYTFWKRTLPPPQMTTFDAPTRETCTVRRERTNTPLQALVLLNEPQFVEAARALAERTMHLDGASTEDRLATMFAAVVARRPDAEEVADLLAAFADHLAAFGGDPEAARQLISTGETEPDPALDPAELAAWTMVANLLLNLDEVINKG